ncbi:lipoprotein [Mesoplasma coleopterae]|uniref:lipoprotein n=1 Tax=Mesoplasma coleopterae TaxID=324078 RepID=UPI000D026A99|nr:lipoprotein [Mesoplasma coleopterae]AVN62064.1 hypothetical protein CG001_00105 [Mesoplasma coleopterae]AVN62726.1 hypothetical protein CG000_00140 [Mesoplasma coleopterae]
MKKLLTILSAVGISATSASVVVSCSTKDGKGYQNIKSIESELSALVLTKTDKAWTIEDLQKEVDLKYGASELKVESITVDSTNDKKANIKISAVGKKFKGSVTIEHNFEAGASNSIDISTLSFNDNLYMEAEDLADLDKVLTAIQENSTSTESSNIDWTKLKIEAKEDGLYLVPNIDQTYSGSRKLNVQEKLKLSQLELQANVGFVTSNNYAIILDAFLEVNKTKISELGISAKTNYYVAVDANGKATITGNKNSKVVSSVDTLELTYEVQDKRVNLDEIEGLVNKVVLVQEPTTSTTAIRDAFFAANETTLKATDGLSEIKSSSDLFIKNSNWNKAEKTVIIEAKNTSTILKSTNGIKVTYSVDSPSNILDLSNSESGINFDIRPANGMNTFPTKDSKNGKKRPNKWSSPLEEFYKLNESKFKKFDIKNASDLQTEINPSSAKYSDNSTIENAPKEDDWICLTAKSDSTKIRGTFFIQYRIN